jgi:putative ABC transport system permease protein
MLRNYLKIGIRNLWRGRLHAIINILGLSVGMVVILLIGGYVLGEISVNKNLKDVERTFVIQSRWTPQNLGVFYTTLGPLAPTLQDQYPLLVEDSYRYTLASTIISSPNGKIFKEQIQIGDSSLITMFGFNLLYGNTKSFFANNGIVLTESVARKYFGRADVLGETLVIQTNAGKEINCQITGILENMPTNSVVNFAANPTSNEIFLSMSSLKYFMGEADKDWSFKYMVSIVKLAEGTEPADLDKPLRRIILSNAPPEFRNAVICELKPLEDYYLQWGNGRILKMVRTLSAIAIFILLVVMANFISIMISSSSYRLREIGLRKLFGGVRKQLILQFLTESILISLIAMVLALVLYTGLRPVFQNLLGKSLVAIQEFNVSVYLAILSLSLCTGVLAGLYPAFRLSGFRIVNAVKGKLPALGEGKFIRKSLLIFQIMVASFVAISSVTFYKQLKFIQHYDLGYNAQGVLVITSVPREWNEAGVSKLEAVRTDLLRDRDIVSASVSYEVPDGNAGNRYNFVSDQKKEVDMPLLNVDEHFALTFGVNLLAGDFFHAREGNYESNRVVLNERAARNFGWTPTSAIGNQITFDGNDKPLTVVGVVENFHFYSLFESVSPISLIHIKDRSSYRYLSLRLVTTDKGNTIERLRKKWSEIFPEAPFDYTFMEDKIDQFYATENRIYQSSKVASLLTVIVTIFGMMAFLSINLVKRVKEFGIRRVHGATPLNLISLLLKDFLWEFIIGGVLACVFAYYFLTVWLSSFQYRIEISFYTFLAVHLGILIFISILITGYSLKTITKNPVNALRCD